MDLATLDDAVDAAFAQLGASTPAWPDPHADRSPSDDEYSRCDNWGKYQILGARVEAWASATVDLGLAVVERGRYPDELTVPGRAFWLRPTQPGAVALHFVLVAIDGFPGSSVEVGIGASRAMLVDLPGCGCDACDDGSERPLDDLDDVIRAAIIGDLIHIAVPGGRIIATSHGSSGSYDARMTALQHQVIVDRARSGTSPYPVTTGRSWLDSS